ncbi:glycoside hydrolase family 127 protein [Paenibacillus sp. 19GGS1-52]|nr:glycoside hydrolase family 127 protein [Paenibacillus sp. 19GGS1-52]
MTISANEWATISRVWKDGDIVEVEFPFALYFKAVDQVNPDIVVLNYGPLVLIADTMTHFIGNAAEPSAWIHPAASKPNSFVTDTGHVAGYDFLTRNFSPYYKVGAMQWYYMYNRIQLPT